MSRTPLIPKRQPLPLPQVGEVWHSQTGRRICVLEIGKPHLTQRERVVVVQKLVGGVHGAKQTMGLPSLLVYYRPPGIKWEPRTYQRCPRVGEVWRTAAGSECVILNVGKASEPRRSRHVTARIVIARGSFVAGDTTTPLVCEMIRRWALVEQKAVA